MSFYKYIIGAAMLCSTQMAFANWSNDCAPCNTCCDRSYYVYADYLYWEVCRTDLDYGFEEDNTDYLCPGYHSGYRLGGNVEFSCFDLGVRYTSFNGSASRAYGEDFRAKHHFDYDVVDIEVGRVFSLDCADVAFRPFVGAKLAWVDQSYSTHDHSIKQDFKGYGLLLGFDSKWNVWNWNRCNTCIPISLVIRASMSILRAERSEHEVGGGSTQFRLDRSDNCHYTPVFEGFAGLNLAYQTDCYGKFNVLIGYEVQSWQGFHRFADNDEVVSIGLGGLVTRLGYSF